MKKTIGAQGGDEVKDPLSCRKPYVNFARIYDEIMADVPYDKWLSYIERIWLRFKFKPESLLDLACGTGNMSLRLAEKGYKVFGLDSSPYMLDVARKKALGKGISVEFFQGDLRDFRLPFKVDAAICLFDSLNYLLEQKDLKAAFDSVYLSLNPHGYFIFDVNTPLRLSLIPKETNLFEGEDYYCVWQDVYDPKHRWWQVSLTGFIKNGDLWERFDEIHRERAFPIEDISSLLLSCGFELKSCYDSTSFRKASDLTSRAYFVCKKGGR